MRYWETPRDQWPKADLEAYIRLITDPVNYRPEALEVPDEQAEAS